MVLPAESGTMTRIVLAGQLCAPSGRPITGTAAAAPASWRNRRRGILIASLSDRPMARSARHTARRRNVAPNVLGGRASSGTRAALLDGAAAFFWRFPADF